MKRDIADLFFYYHTDFRLPEKIHKLLDEAKRESGDRLPVVVFKDKHGGIIEVIRRKELQKITRSTDKDLQSLWCEFLMGKLLRGHKR